MTWLMRFSGFVSFVMALVILSPSLQSFPPAEAIRSSNLDGYLRLPVHVAPTDSENLFSFRKASAFRNADKCGSNITDGFTVCDPNLVHVAITLDIEYLRGSIAAVHSILQHSLCPENIFFHFLVSEPNLEALVDSSFPN